jgi:hypothetical protein
MVALTAVTPEGRRFPVFGRIGQNLASALAGCAYPDISSHVAVLSPRHGEEAHVRVAHEFISRLAPLDEDGRDRLDEICDDVRDDSRLASTVRAHAAARAWGRGGVGRVGRAAGRARCAGAGIRRGGACCGKGCGEGRGARGMGACQRAQQPARIAGAAACRRTVARSAPSPPASCAPTHPLRFMRP